MPWLTKCVKKMLLLAVFLKLMPVSILHLLLITIISKNGKYVLLCYISKPYTYNLYLNNKTYLSLAEILAFLLHASKYKTKFWTRILRHHLPAKTMSLHENDVLLRNAL